MSAPAWRETTVYAQRGGTAAPASAGASLGGASAGTGLVAIAQSIGPSSTLGTIFLYVTPVLSFLIGLALYFVQIQVDRYFEQRIVNNARKTLENQLQNPRVSVRHKAKIRAMLEDLERSVATAELQRVKSIGTLLPDP